MANHATPGPHRHAPGARERGATLVEALIACAALALGIVALSRGHGELRGYADIARQRTEAVQLAQRELESLRAYASLSSASPSFAGIQSGAEDFDAAAGDTTYRLHREIETDAQAKTAAVRVEWNDRRGATQQVVLETVIARRDPALAAVLGIAPRGRPVLGAYGRAPAIPVAARDLGNGTSILKPVEADALVLVFDNATGAMKRRCTSVAAEIPTSRLREEDLVDCLENPGLLLSGVIRYATSGETTPCDAPAACEEDAAGRATVDAALLAVTVEIEPRGSEVPTTRCSSEPRKTVALELDGVREIVAVPIAAEPSSFGLASWTELGERHVAYHCVVAPDSEGRWSGRSVLQPLGWAIGNAAGQYRVCRYVADLDGSGAIDGNLEHPAIYQQVSEALMQQNFLVVEAGASCPAGAPGVAGAFANESATLQHQP